MENKNNNASNSDERNNQHAWKLSRERCIFNILKKSNLHNVADIGVNDMFYTNKLKAFVDGKIYGVDIVFPDDETVKQDIICLNDVGKIPDNELDCIIMMDVLEHIDDDVSFIQNAIPKLKDNGMILVTVPAWQFLFSAHDVVVHHHRRYNRKQIMELLKHNDIKVERCHYFYTILFFVRLLLLFRKDKFAGNNSGWKYSANHIITKIIKTILNIDFGINKILDKIGIHLPGLSLLAICRKRT